MTIPKDDFPRSDKPKNETVDDNLGRVRWHCRRGLKEIDVILNPFLDEFYVDLSAHKKLVFQRLLNCYDVDLLEWFMGRSESEDDEVQEMVDEILRSLGAKS